MKDADLYRLMAWLSPSYPVGAFSYSHGIEWLVETGDIKDAESLSASVRDIMLFGSGRNDAILFAEAHRAVASKDNARLQRISELASAFSPTAERYLETMSQGRAFAATTCTAWKSPTLDSLLTDEDAIIAYPVAVAVATADHGVELRSALSAYLHAFVANLVSAGVRLIPLGHTAGQIAMTRLESVVAQTTDTGLVSSPDDVGGAAFMVDVASMKHETQYTRLFRS